MSALRSIYILLALGCFLQFTACKKTDTPAPAPTTTTPVDKFADIKTSASFDWSNSQSINLQVVGLSTIINDKNFLKVMSADGQQVYFTQYISINQSINPAFSIPRGTTSVLVTFGSISKTVSIANNKAVFDYTKI